MVGAAEHGIVVSECLLLHIPLMRFENDKDQHTKYQRAGAHSIATVLCHVVS
jgi:hypothetical protein